MRIDHYNNLAQNLRQSGTTGSVPVPNFAEYNFNTKGAPAMSDEKYKEAIIEQAKKDQAAGKFQSDSAGFRSLAKSYISTVSPDRKNIITQGLKAIFKSNKPPQKTLSWIDYMLGKVKYHKEAANVSYAEFYSGNGEMVASYSNGKWISYGTQEENARESELFSIYNAAWNNAARASQGNIPAASADTTSGLINQSV